MRSLASLFISLAIFGSPALAKDRKVSRSNRTTQSSLSPNCRLKMWTGPRNLSKQQWVAKLSAIPRSEVRSLAWGEALSQNPQPIFPVFLIYLAKTEPNNLLAGYYEGILYIMNQSIPWRKVVENWPQKIDMSKVDRSYWSLAKFCDEYVKAGGTF